MPQEDLAGGGLSPRGTRRGHPSRRLPAAAALRTFSGQVMMSQAVLRRGLGRLSLGDGFFSEAARSLSQAACRSSWLRQGLT